MAAVLYSVLVLVSASADTAVVLRVKTLTRLRTWRLNTGQAEANTGRVNPAGLLHCLGSAI